MGAVASFVIALSVFLSRVFYLPQNRDHRENVSSRNLSPMHRALAGDRNDSRCIFNTPSRVRISISAASSGATLFRNARAAKLFI